MKKLKGWLVLGGLVLLVGAALADFNVRDHSTHKQNASTGQRVTEDGHLTTEEQAPEMDANLTFTNIIGTTTLTAAAATNADSSAVLDTHRMRLGMLLIKATPTSVTGADSLGIVRLGVQVRTHLQGASDSSSTFPIYWYGRSDLGGVAAASQIDTSATGQIFNAVNLAASANSAHSGEFVTYVAINRLGPGTSVVGSLGQRPYFWPNGIAIPLQNFQGREIYSPFTSVRIRNLGTVGPANRSIIVTAHLVGTPL